MAIITPSRPRNTHQGRRARSAIRPAEGSLWWNIRQYPRKALFKEPDRWSDLHNKVLGVSWYEVKIDNTHRIISVNEEDIAKLQSCVPELLKTRNKGKFTELLQMTLVTLWPGVFSEVKNIPRVFDIHFDTRIYKEAVRVDAAWACQPIRPTPVSHSSNMNLNQVSLLDQVLICYAEMRRWLRPNPTENDPIKRLDLLRHNSLLSPDPHHDAQFVGILLAMAQRVFYAQDSTEGLPGSFADTKMRVITLDREAREFIVYKGHITKEFLTAFHAPFEGELDEEIRLRDPTITYTRVPLRPVLDLKGRLGEALGREIVGDLSK